MTERATLDRRPAVSGKLFVVPFAILIAFLLWLIVSMAIRFQVLMVQVEKSRAAWPAASQELATRYDRLLNDASELEPTKRSELQKLHEEFSGVTQFDLQGPRVVELERFLHSNGLSNLEKNSINDGEESIQELLQLEKVRGELESDFVGRCTVAGLRLKLPPVFSLPPP